MSERENKMLTCIICPLGCSISVTMEDGTIAETKGFGCKRGKNYAETECIAPMRVITSTVRVVNGPVPLISVKTDKPVPKALVMECMKEINRIEAHSPVKIGDILLVNVLGTGADIVATCNA
ncbi:MAG TPA: DUF1667 domain-containing protein [Clostridia bacterium]|nr:DUF1667 domain-containing protein [Clostridia bacterium]